MPNYLRVSEQRPSVSPQPKRLELPGVALIPDRLSVTKIKLFAECRSKVPISNGAESPEHFLHLSESNPLCQQQRALCIAGFGSNRFSSRTLERVGQIVFADRCVL